MNFALFTTTFFPTVGGAEKQLDLLARGLLMRGHFPLVIAPLVPKKNNEVRAPYSIYRYPRLHSKRFGLRWHARFLDELHQKYSFDWIHGHGAYPAGYMTKSFAQRHKIPLVIRAYGGDVLPGEQIRSSLWLNYRLKKTLASAQLLIAQNAELETILGLLSGHPERVFRLTNGVEIESFATELSSNIYKNEAAFAITLSTFYPKKGLDILIRAWALVVQKLPQAKLKIAGHGPEENILRTLICKLNLDKSVALIGQVKGLDKVRLLQASSLYISSARREPFSNALLEAVAAGNQVVATHTGGNREIVEKTQSGVLIPPENEFALAEAICAQFPRGRPVLSQEQRIKRMSDYSADQMVDNYLTLLDKVE